MNFLAHLTLLYLSPILLLMRKIVPFLFALAALFLPFALYLKTLSPTYIPIDSAEFALCMKFWGMCHPPGFPLYIAVGHYFVNFFPLGSVIFKANLFSAVFGSLTIFVVYLALLELKVNRVTALFLGLFLAVNAVFWEFSIAADVFTFGTFLIALAIYFAIRGWAIWSFFVLGLSASHFYISAILWPVFVWHLITSSKLKVQSAKLILKLTIYTAVFILGFFPQAVMYWRMQENPVINWGHAQGFSGFLYFIRRQEFGSIFLLSNPALTFHLGKTIKHISLYFQDLFVTFGVVLPLLPIAAGFFGVFKNKKFIFLLACFFVLAFVQLFLLSTIDPTGENNPFQINKFYLSTFVIVPLLAGVSIEAILRRVGWERTYVYVLLGFLIFIYFLANIRVTDYSNNRFSENFVADALSNLPENSVAITVNHLVYFAGLYEQKINGKYKSTKLLYFPNEKNRDSEKYRPELFSGKVDSEFVNKVSKNKNMGEAEKYVLETIARNLDKKIYILQGPFEAGFFAYLAPYLRPYGLWWYIEPDLASESITGESRGLFNGLKNGGLSVEDLILKQQKLDLQTYAVSYHSTAISLGAEGKYDEAVEFLNKSRAIDAKLSANIQNEIDLLIKTKELEAGRQNLVSRGDKDKLKVLGNNYFTIRNFAMCETIFGEVLTMEQSAGAFTNLAGCQALQGKDDLARENYEKALSIDPNFEMAKAGLSAIEMN